MWGGGVPRWAGRFCGGSKKKKKKSSTAMFHARADLRVHTFHVKSHTSLPRRKSNTLKFKKNKNSSFLRTIYNSFVCPLLTIGSSAEITPFPDNAQRLEMGCGDDEAGIKWRNVWE